LRRGAVPATGHVAAGLARNTVYGCHADRHGKLAALVLALCCGGLPLPKSLCLGSHSQLSVTAAEEEKEGEGRGRRVENDWR